MLPTNSARALPTDPALHLAIRLGPAGVDKLGPAADKFGPAVNKLGRDANYKEIVKLTELPGLLLL